MGIELTPMGDIKTATFPSGTSVRRVYAAGDIGTPMKTALGAMNSGILAGAGAHYALIDEELET